MTPPRSRTAHILTILGANPGSTADAIAKLAGTDASNVRTMLNTHVVSGAVESEDLRPRVYWLARMPDLPITHRVPLVLAEAGHECSRQEIQQRLGCSIRTVSSALAVLCGSGRIVSRAVTARRFVYSLPSQQAAK